MFFLYLGNCRKFCDNCLLVHLLHTLNCQEILDSSVGKDSLHTNFKPIPIRPQREFLPKPHQTVAVEGAMQHGLLVRLRFGDDQAPWVDDLRLAAIMQPMGILAYTVHAHPIGLVFNGTGLQQCVPDIHP